MEMEGKGAARGSKSAVCLLVLQFLLFELFCAVLDPAVWPSASHTHLHTLTK